MEGVALPVACPGCAGVIGPQDRYCRHCGRRQGGSTPWYHRHWGIAVSTLALGPLAIALAWRSPRLSLTARWLWTVAILAFTVYAGLLFYRAWSLAMSRLAEFGGALEGL